MRSATARERTRHAARFFSGAGQMGSNDLPPYALRPRKANDAPRPRPPLPPSPDDAHAPVRPRAYALPRGGWTTSARRRATVRRPASSSGGGGLLGGGVRFARCGVLGGRRGRGGEDGRSGRRRRRVPGGRRGRRSRHGRRPHPAPGRTAPPVLRRRRHRCLRRRARPTAPRLLGAAVRCASPLRPIRRGPSPRPSAVTPPGPGSASFPSCRAVLPDGFGCSASLTLMQPASEAASAETATAAAVTRASGRPVGGAGTGAAAGGRGAGGRRTARGDGAALERTAGRPVRSAGTAATDACQGDRT